MYGRASDPFAFDDTLIFPDGQFRSLDDASIAPTLIITPVHSEREMFEHLPESQCFPRVHVPVVNMFC